MAEPIHDHKWVEMPAGTGLTRGVPFRFCSKCDREEWRDGTIRPGWIERRPLQPPVTTRVELVHQLASKTEELMRQYVEKHEEKLQDPHNLAVALRWWLQHKADHTSIDQAIAAWGTVAVLEMHAVRAAAALPHKIAGPE